MMMESVYMQKCNRTMLKKDICIVFSHFGYSKYLEYTLRCAKLTNPKAKLVFIGDSKNKKVALATGWEHYDMRILRRGELWERFNACYKTVQGRNHHNIKNGQDWLRYVFERWFLINNFLLENSISSFWHFDSDTMILQDLSQFSDVFDSYDFSVQCGGTCLNGFSKADILKGYGEFTCELFEDESFIQNQQKEFDTINTNYAFTEMRAFDLYKQSSHYKWIHLMYFTLDRVFDDCIYQDNGFETYNLYKSKIIKNIFFEYGSAFGIRDKRKINFVTLNLSCVPDELFEWVYESVRNKSTSSCSELRLHYITILILFLRKIKQIALVFHEHKKK